MLLENKHILLGVTGGIAAYKSAELVRRLRDAGAQVKVVMTAGAQAFITPLTLQAVSNEKVHTDLLNADAEVAMGHIELARWADVVLIAPATADVLAKLAHGLADDLLTTLCLATTAPLAVAPAMNQQMWQAAATQANCAILRQRGVPMLGPAAGAQACGEVGAGRMLEPLEIIDCLGDVFVETHLVTKTVLITAGPTREDIDPVRYISNRSSGKMGYALASAARAAGANVVLVSGPTTLSPPPLVEYVSVYSAESMFKAVQQYLSHTDIFIAAAAVADYRPLNPAEQKIKKNHTDMQIVLTRTTDILQTVAQSDKAPFCVGFAAETQDVAHYARDKLQRKGLNMIAANQVGINQGFDRDDNALHVIWADGEVQLEQANKRVLAQQLMDLIIQRYFNQL